MSDMVEGNKRRKTTSFLLLDLPDVAIQLISSFLHFEELLIVRATSKRLKTLVDAALLDKTMKALPVGLHFSAFPARCKVHLQQGWTEKFNTLDNVITYALDEMGQTSWFVHGRMRDFAEKCLRERGQYSDATFQNDYLSDSDSEDPGNLLEWKRQVEFEDDLPHRSALDRLKIMFQNIGDKVEFKFDRRRISRYVFERSDEEVDAEKSQQLEEIRTVKRACFSLFVANGSDKISMSYASGEDAVYRLEFERDESSSVTVFRLANSTEMYFYEDIEALDSSDY